MGQERDDLLQPGEDLVIGRLGVLHEPLRVGDLGSKAILAFLEYLHGQGVRHVGIEQLLTLSFKFSQTPALVGDEPTP
ncbi:hypothetical protein [Nocardioides sp.]|uniref:hypothetical protein n=1 Tax=Nocardioides sp. TaxID=35761 RepID=UPI0039E62B70